MSFKYEYIIVVYQMLYCGVTFITNAVQKPLRIWKKKIFFISKNENIIMLTQNSPVFLVLTKERSFLAEVQTRI